MAHRPQEPDSVPAAQPAGQPQVRDIEKFTGHRVRLHIFEGPLDLLLYLVRAHRYDIFDIPIHEVTQQFCEFLRLMEEIDVEYAGEFLVTAATLMQIKARMLLPPQQSANEDEVATEAVDPRAELVARLLEYQRLQDAAETLKGLHELRAQTFPRAAPPQEEGIIGSSNGEAADGFLLLQDVSTFDLLRALAKVLDRVAERPVALVLREPFSVPERIRYLLTRLAADEGGATFSVLCNDCQSRHEVVVTFLALLELIRRGRVQVAQRALFDEIWITLPSWRS